MLKMPSERIAAFRPILEALDRFPADAAVPGLLVVRPGYRYQTGGEGTSRTVATPAIILAVIPSRLAAAQSRAAELEAGLGVPVEAQEASLDEQLAAYDQDSRAFVVPPSPLRSPFEDALRGGRAAVTFVPLSRSSYQKPEHLVLKEVHEHMAVTLSVSPEQGWPVLEPFLKSVQQTFTIGMYQFTAPHIADAVVAAAGHATGDVLLVLHPVPEAPPPVGVKAHDRPEAEIVTALQGSARNRFGLQWAPVGKDGVFASAYHIKVGVADGSRFWLSSGNWQSSNQPGPGVLAQIPQHFQQDYNRDCHAVIESTALASIFEAYLKYDFETARQSAPRQPQSWEGPPVQVPVDYEPLPRGIEPRFFPPLVINRVVRVQPLLTPDNYAARVLELVRSAQKTVYFQNQYINLSPTQNHPEFEQLVEALIERQKQGVEVQIICRDLMTSEKLDLLVAKGFDPEWIRFQHSCHNKCIIIDSSAIVFGSHNWSNDGAVSNRDASLIFYDEEIARYFTQVYLYDWANLATAKPTRLRRGPFLVEGTELTGEVMHMGSLEW